MNLKIEECLKTFKCPFCERHDYSLAEGLIIRDDRVTIKYLHNCDKLKSNEPIIYVCIYEEDNNSIFNIVNNIMEIFVKYDRHMIYYSYHCFNIMMDIPNDIWSKYLNFKPGDKTGGLMDDYKVKEIRGKVPFEKLHELNLIYYFSNDGWDGLMFE